MAKKYSEFIDSMVNEQVAKVKLSHSKGDVLVNFGVMSSGISESGQVIFMAKSGKDLDKLYHFEQSVIQDTIVEYLNKQFKEVQFIKDWQYEGAGFSFKIDMGYLIKKIK